MSEDEAHRRIVVARIVREFPRALSLLEDGKVHLSAVYALRDRLTHENHEELLGDAVGKTMREVEWMLAARFPRPDVATCIEPVAPQPQLPVPLPHEGTAPSVAHSFGAEVRPTIEPLSATRYRVELTVSADIKTKLERIKDLMRHRNPTGDLEVILGASLDLLLTKLERGRLGKVSRTRGMKRGEANAHAAKDLAAHAHDRHVDAAVIAESSERRPDAGGIVMAGAHGVVMPGAVGGSPTAALAARADAAATAKEAALPADGTWAKQRRDDTTEKARRRHIPRHVRGEVFARDGEQCSYVDAEGNRCPARAFLELDHVHPAALGGSDDAANLRVRCRAHSQHYAEQVFGRQHVAARIHSRRLEYTSPPSTRFDTAAHGLRSLGFREKEIRRALATLETKLGNATPLETILREALLILT